MPGIVLEFSQHGDFDSFDVIRSLTSMAGLSDSQLPSPIATGLLTMYYVDTAVVEDATYYYKFRVWRDGISLVSDEVEVIAQYHDPNILINMPFSNNINNVGKYADLPVQVVGSASIQDGCLYIPTGSYLKLNTSGYSAFDVGSGDFEFGVEVAMMPSGHGGYPCLFAIGTAWDIGAVSMQYSPSKQFMGAFYNAFERDAFSPSVQVYDGVTFDKYIVRRISGVVTTYKNGEPGTPLTSENMNVNLTRNNTVTIGAALWSIGITQSHSKIKNLYFKKV